MTVAAGHISIGRWVQTGGGCLFDAKCAELLVIIGADIGMAVVNAQYIRHGR